ncbi:MULTISPECIES: STAS domain-containing protein [Giesbergeria]|uniref:STAS domain-containing protein n=1 Tax=Giesbergeria sinuosa TaxID=80883 RepID=A0ABV9QD40_9BURK
MSKEESSPGGLLSKVVRFVRNPTVNWTDLDTIETDRESQYSKQVLKEMLERKRRNDFVRKREFDYLRKLRQRDALAGHRVEDPAVRPSFFQSSLTPPDDRAGTIKKIDEIEAQMSMQWWKGKSATETAVVARPTATAPTRLPVQSEASETRPPQHLAPGLFPQPLLRGGDTSPASLSGSFASTVPVSLPVGLEPQAGAEPLFAHDSMPIADFGGASAQWLSSTPDAPPDFFPLPAVVPPVPMEPFVHDPDLEEAAILFANADYAGAGACLLDVVAQHPAEASAQLQEIWMTLFDLYRATGQQEAFDHLAIDFAAQFGRSAPLWFSMPEQLGLVSATQASAAAPARRDFSWNAPSSLTVQSVAALQASLGRAAPPWTMIWSRVASIDEAALPALTQEFNRWGDQKAQLVFVGAERLQALLQAHTQSGDRSSNPEWWRLRMAALRFMGQPEEFELVALDYCVTYEVSPPSWVDPRCSYVDAAEGDGASHDLLAPSAPAGAGDAVAPVGLSGHIEGDATEALQALEVLVRPGEPLVVPCDRLIRVDFSAAGAVLNWAAEQQAQKREVHFKNLHRLVAVLFNVVGINEHAWVIPRKN